MKSSVVIEGLLKAKDPGSLSGMVGMGVENLREGERVLRGLTHFLHPCMEPNTTLPAPVWEREQMEWSLCHCEPSLLSSKHRAGTSSLGLSTPIARACKSTQTLPRASIVSTPNGDTCLSLGLQKHA